jgi:hypothetical protein
MGKPGQTSGIGEAGTGHSFALRRDGSLAAWGLSDIFLPAGLRDSAQISAMDGNLIGIKKDGKVVADEAPLSQ